MKKYILVFSLLAVFIIKPAFAKDSYQIKFKFKNLKDTEIFLGYHFGSKKFISDTTQVDNKGIAVFKGKEMLPGGVYLMILPSKNFMEFIVAEDDISIEIDTSDFISETKIIKSEENVVFYTYLNL
jgi:ribosomal protein S8